MQTIFHSVRRFAARGTKVLLGVAIVGLVVSLADPAGAVSMPTRTNGFPVTSNGASSMHLTWAEAPAPTKEVSAVVEIVEQPTVQQLYFWALQVQFVDRSGKEIGEAHLGLQWQPKFPGSTAVNFGGYEAAHSTELTGSASNLPSATGDANTRNYAWKVGHQYKLRIFGTGDGWWTGEVADLETNEVTVVRRIFGGGAVLAKPVVWSEVFAKCDDPASSVRWSSLSPRPNALQATYQSFNSGACTNTTMSTSSKGIVQRTNSVRTVRDFDLVRSGF